LCTINYEDEISLTVLFLSSGETINMPIKVKLNTKLSTKLDPDELIQEKKLGEGSFGIVYFGDYRGNKVAIKRMKMNEVSINTSGKTKRNS
jgi:predicted Ser/Thr protein kinase